MPVNVSIIMPAYNSSTYIAEAVQSVMDQSYGDWELLIIDDSSSDGTLEVIKSFADRDKRIVVIELENNSGAAFARNEGLKIVSGRFVAFLDSDDAWLPNKLEMQLLTFSSTDAVLVYSPYWLCEEDLENKTGSVTAPNYVELRDLFKGNPIGCCTAMYDRDKVGEVLFPDIRMRNDWGFWIRLLSKGGSGVCVQERLVVHRIRPNSLTAQKVRAFYFTYLVLRTELNLGIFRSIIGIFQQVMGSMLRRKKRI